LIFLVPLVVIVLLVSYTVYLTHRVRGLEAHANVLDALEEINVAERYYANDKNVTWIIKKYEEITARYPDARLLARLGGLYIAKGDIDKAIEVLKGVSPRDKNFWEARSLLVYAYLLQGREKDALDAGEQAVQLNKLDAQTLNNIAWVYAKAGDQNLRDVNKALKYASMAVEYTRANNVRFLDTLAEVQLVGGDGKAALKTIEQAIEREDRFRTYLLCQRERIRDSDLKKTCE